MSQDIERDLPAFVSTFCRSTQAVQKRIRVSA